MSAADFRDANFLADTVMYNLICDHVALFKGAVFAGSTGFGDARFGGLAQFDGTGFHTITFWGAQFYEDASFRGATLDGLSDFSNAVFHQRADFRGTHFSGSQPLMQDAFAESLQFDSWTQIAASLTQIERYSGGSDTVSFAQATDLVEVAKTLAMVEGQGLADEAHAAYYAGRQHRRHAAIRAMTLSPGTWWEPVKATLVWITSGYGVRPQYTLFLGFAIILFCTVCFYPPDAISMDAEHGGYRARSGIKPPGKRLRDAFSCSVTTFTTVGYGDWYPRDVPVKLGSLQLSFIRYRTIAMLEGVTGWILITVFVISLGKTWIGN